MLGIYFFEGTTLHGYGESFNKWGTQAPDLSHTLCGGSTQRADIKKYVLAKQSFSIPLELRNVDRWIY
jgi:hypothetical protein